MIFDDDGNFAVQMVAGFVLGYLAMIGILYLIDQLSAVYEVEERRRIRDVVVSMLVEERQRAEVKA
jgi:hypothetical protein